MSYVVIWGFTDLQDNNRKYRVGDAFPYPGVVVTEARVAELAGPNNRRGAAVITEVPAERTGSHEETLSNIDTGKTTPNTTKAKRKAREKA